jgi:hypothetical protein
MIVQKLSTTMIVANVKENLDKYKFWLASIAIARKANMQPEEELSTTMIVVNVKENSVKQKLWLGYWYVCFGQEHV